jgi:hypothetical protein
MGSGGTVTDAPKLPPGLRAIGPKELARLKAKPPDPRRWAKNKAKAERRKRRGR